MSKGKEIVHFQFEGHPEIMQSHNWRLEMDVNLHRNRLGLPFWTKYKTIPNDDIDPNPEQDLTIATLSSNVGDSPESTVVSKSSRKSKSRKKTSDMLPVQQLLDHITPLDLVPEVLRHKFDGSPNPFSNGMDLGDNVQETK
jgi:hypothetical protein